MKVDFTQKIHDFEGRNIIWPDEVKSINGVDTVLASHDATLGDFAKTAVLNAVQGDPPQAQEGEAKYKMYLLATKIRLGEEVTIDELATIKTRIGKFYPAQTVGVCWQLLEAAGKPKPSGTVEKIASGPSGGTDAEPAGREDSPEDTLDPKQ